MNQTPMTTGEAIATLCAYTTDMHSNEFEPQDRLCVAVALLCEQYGLRLTDYFTDA